MNPRHPGIACSAPKTRGACIPKVFVPRRPIRAAQTLALIIEARIADLVRNILMVLVFSDIYVWY